MRFERKIGLLMICTVLPYMCAVAALVLYIRAHPGGPVPRWISVPMLCLFILTIVGGGMFLSRAAKKQARSETPEEGRFRRARAIKGLKAGLLVWTLILLNDVRMLAQGTIPWTAGIAGLAIVTLLIAASWVSLKRLKKVEMTSPDSDKNYRSPQ
jgi:hypothetical protein